MYYCRIINQNKNTMKKLLYLFLVIPFIFSSCEEEEEANTPVSIAGCTSSSAWNYDPTATTDDGSCIYGGSMMFWFYYGTPGDLGDLGVTTLYIDVSADNSDWIQLGSLSTAGTVGSFTAPSCEDASNVVFSTQELPGGSPLLFYWRGRDYLNNIYDAGSEVLSSNDCEEIRIEI